MSIEKPKMSSPDDSKSTDIPETEKEEVAEIIHATKEFRSIIEKIKTNDVKIGDVVSIRQKYENIKINNPFPVEIKFPDDGFTLNYRSAEVISESNAFKEYIEANTEIKSLLEEFASSYDQDYLNFRDNIYNKYSEKLKEQGIWRIEYHKYGQSRSTPARLAMFVEKRKFDHFFGKEDDYDNKLEMYNKKEEIIKDFYEAQENLKEIAEIDEILVELKEKTKMNDDEIMNYLKVDDIYTNFNQIKPLVNVMLNSSFEKDRMFAQITSGGEVEGDYVLPNIVNESSHHDEISKKLYLESLLPHPDNVKATKIYSKGIRVVADGRMGAVKFPPYMKYEDFVGGKTINYPENNVGKILDVSIVNNEVRVIYLNGNNVKCEQVFTKMESVNDKSVEYIKEAKSNEKEGGFYGYGTAGENYEKAGLLDKAQEMYEKAIEAQEKDYKYTKHFEKKGFKEAKQRYDEIKRNKKAEFDSWTSGY